jgi:hypothetical protein
MGSALLSFCGGIQFLAQTSRKKAVFFKQNTINFCIKQQFVGNETDCTASL